MTTTSTPLTSIAVFCGANPGRDPCYRAAAEALGAELAARQIELIFGGGSVGLMGVIADAVLADGGQAVGVITEQLKGLEVGHNGLTRLEVVDTMHTRKRRMFELAGAIVAMPGGIGTYDELFESLTWNQLGIHDRPCGLLNVDGFYDPLLQQLDRAVEQGFVRVPRQGMLIAAPDAGTLVDRLVDRSLQLAQ